MDPDLIGLIVSLVMAFGTIVVAMVIGSLIERSHYQSIQEREARLLNLPAIPTRLIDDDRTVAQSCLVAGSVVVSIDYFKRFLGNLRNIVGGRVRSYESLVDRGRREAILRMKEQWPDADIIVNLRIETSTIGNVQQGNNQSIGAIEVIAYGTAIKYAKMPGDAA